MKTKKTVCRIIGITASTVIGFLVIPPLMKKYSYELYKRLLKKDEIDFENLGPEIVKKHDKEEEEEKAHDC